MSLTENIFVLGLVKDINDKCGATVGEQDKFGWTPLHHAVHFGLEVVVVLFLANIDKSPAYKKDKEGMCAFHVATKNGHIGIMEKLRSICPDISELLTHNGENALHVAVKVRKTTVVESILKTLGYNSLLNKQDKDGNTPLHLAAIIEDYEILVMLLNDKRVKANIVSKDGLTAMDITQSSTKLGVSEKLDLISKLKSIGGFCSLKQQHIVEPNMASQNINAAPPLEDQGNKEHQLEKVEGIKATDEEGEIAKDFDLFLWMVRPFLDPGVAKEAVEMDRLIATIIATVTFGAAFQVPGGYESGGPFQGLPVLRHRTLFNLFLIFDALAFGLSSSSIFLHFVATKFGPDSALLVFKKVKKNRTNLLV
ncbi:Transmembrane protein [Parasponia andersonii]|uniref:Transmembrane protein n=1 Tax=Parasponia andersonii TaxID=3476 RepID=A0A2P5CWJ3_PARAD|nr:Transmembrane protein [Parasponia andersonii]